MFVTIAVAVGNAGKRMGHPHRPSSQLRGIHQGLVTFANSNKNKFPGLAPDGTTINLRVEHRYQILLEGDFFTPEYAISPWETEPITPWEEGEGYAVTAANYSFAMLQLPKNDNGGRRHEWSQTLN
ncbi:MAG: hypothetical protein AAF085_15765, partial [Planctomycetota bacterium]